MDVRQIKYIIALYEEQSITNASRRLNVVQPAVSMQLRKIEKDYGLQLFDRTPDGLSPTPVARTLYPVCLKVLEDLRAAEQIFELSRDSISGSLNIGVSPSLADSLLGELLIVCNQRYPGISIRCHEGYSSNLVDWLADGTVDFAILTTIQSDNRFATTPLFSERITVVTSPCSEEDAASPIRGEELAKFKLVLPTPRNSLRVLIERKFREAGLRITPTVEVDSLPAVFTMLQTPGWASIVPSLAVLPGTHSALQRRALVDPLIERSLSVVYHIEKKPNLAGEKFIEQLRRLIEERQES